MRQNLRSRSLAFSYNFDRVSAKLGAKHVAEPHQAAGGVRQHRGKVQWRALLAGERKGDIGPAHRQAPRHIAHSFRFGPIAFQKL